MAEYCSMEQEDWGLQAIVRACTHDQYTTNNSLLDYNYHHDDLFYDFPEFEEMKSNDNSLVVNELDDLYKPLYDPNVCSFSPQLEHSDSLGNEVKFEQEAHVKDVLQQSKIIVVAKPKAVTPPAKYKRKSQQKRVVVQVTAEGLSSDLWAWRKYGQKPIKGSPYPRSYYRCSSSKGCLARRQVEQSCTDPGMFIITYSADHNHSQPTRRSSLAGTNRQKFSTLKTSTVSSTPTKQQSNFSQSSMSIHVDAVQTLKKIKHDRTIDDIDEPSMDHEFVIPDSILIDDFFVAFDDLDGLISNNSSLYACSSQ